VLAGEVAEWKTELADKHRQKDALKKIIAAMTIGKDVSAVFAEVTSCSQTSDLELKKLVYLYLINYAKSQPELAIMAVNTFVKVLYRHNANFAQEQHTHTGCRGYCSCTRSCVCAPCATVRGRRNAGEGVALCAGLQRPQPDAARPRDPHHGLHPRRPHHRVPLRPPREGAQGAPRPSRLRAVIAPSSHSARKPCTQQQICNSLLRAPAPAKDALSAATRVEAPPHQTSDMQDTDPYVRKTAAICVAKLHDMSPELVRDRGFLDALRDLTTDSNPMVVSNAVAALAEIAEASGGPPFVVSKETSSYLLTAMEQCTEWGQARFATVALCFAHEGAVSRRFECSVLSPRQQ
jgi:non-SMC mitotic condensation complex subunit 1/Adaptin N terminal region